MTENVITVAEDTFIEDAALIMAENKIGCVPLMKGYDLIGIITETDILNRLPEMLAIHHSGIRATFLIKEKPCQLAKVTKIIADHGGNFISFVQFAGEHQHNRLVTIKINGLLLEGTRESLDPIVEKVLDIREN